MSMAFCGTFGESELTLSKWLTYVDFLKLKPARHAPASIQLPWQASA